MSFKRFIIIVFFLSIPMANYAQSLEPQPLGLVIRPRLFESLVQSLGKGNQNLKISDCIKRRGIKGRFSFSLSSPEWSSINNDRIGLKLQLDAFNFKGSAYETCEAKRAFASGEVRIGKSPVTTFVRVAPEAISSTGSAASFDSTAITHLGQALEVDFEGLEELEVLMNQEDIKLLLAQSLAKHIETLFTRWLRDALRKLVFGRFVHDFLEESPFWDEGVELSSGGVWIQNRSPKGEDRSVAFLFYPRRTSSSSFQVSEEGLALFLNATFLNGDQVRSLSGLKLDRSLDEHLERLIERLRNWELREDATFENLNIESIDTDVTLFFAQGLSNKALRETYAEDLLEIDTVIDIGEQTKGFLSENAPEVKTRIEIASNQAPIIEFRPDELSLRVFNYRLKLGTEIEDRIIPSTEIDARVSVNADVFVDNRAQTVNLRTKSETFKIELTEGKRFRKNLSSSDLEVVEDIVNEVWQDFFNQYPQLVLFPTVFTTKTADLALEGFRFDRGNIHIHMNVDPKSLQIEGAEF